jgi:transposase-like protein
MGIRRYTITDFRAQYPNEDACLDRLFQLRYKHLVCPDCESDKAFKRVKNRRSYQCPACGYQIYPTQGTVFEKSTTPLLYWFQAIFLQTTTRNGVAAKELERQLNVCYKTALRMAHQIKILMAKPILPFTGVIQADETFIGGLNKNRHADKKIADSQGRSVKDKIPVLGMMNMSGKIIAKVIPDTSRISITPILRENMVKDACVLVTDEWWAYREIAKEMPHVIVNHTLGEYVSGAFHTNTIEGFWSQLKRTIKGTHIHVSREHLQKYVDEVCFRYMNRDKQDTMFETILSHVV